MAFVIKDRVFEYTTTTGTGTLTLGGTKSGYQQFAVVGDGNTTYYTIVAKNGDWESGIGTYTSSGTTLARTTVLSSSNSNNLVNFTAGTKEVFSSLPASGFVEKLSSTANLQDLTSATSARSNLGLGAAAVAGVYTGGTAPSSSDVMSSSPANIELNYNGSGNRTTFVDFHSKDGTDYDARIIKNTGNGDLDILATNGSVINTVSLSTIAQSVLFNRSGNLGGVMNVTSGTGTAWLGLYHDNSAVGQWFAGFNRAGSTIGAIVVASASSVAYNTTSDYRLKEHVLPMVGALDRIMAANPVTYKWKSDGSAGEGFIAHELAEVVPLAVTGEKDAVDEDGKPKYQQVDYAKLTLYC